MVNIGRATETPPATMFRTIFQALREHNAPMAGPADVRLFAIPIEDAGGAVLGGIWAHSVYRWMAIDMLFVPEAVRGRKIGSDLLRMLEAEALLRGCVGVQVDTFSFQARPFYEKQGFTAFGLLEGYPPGHGRIFMSKTFVPNVYARPLKMSAYVN